MSSRTGQPSQYVVGAVVAIAMLLAGLLCTARPAVAAAIPVPLGRAESFSVLGGMGVTNTGPTILSADLGASTAVSVVGFPPGVVQGETHSGDTAATQALASLTAAYDNAAGRTPDDPTLAGDLNGRTLGPGVYRADAAIAVTGTVTLDAGGQPNAVFIFQLGAALNTAAFSNVSLVNGASSSNVFWQVVGATGIGANSSMSGTILTNAAITVGAGATLTGRALSSAVITLASNSITTPPVVTITGASTVYAIVNPPTISGTTDAAPGTTVTVTIAGQTLTATIAEGGAWSVTAATVPNGSFRVVATVTGPAGNKSSAYQTLIFGGDPSVPLGRAGSFSVLGGMGVTNTGATIVSADLGASTAASVVGFPPGIVGGVTHYGDTPATQALADLALAYNDAAGRSTANPILAGDLNGRTLTPGVYRADAAIAVTGTVTLDAGGQPNAVFIFQLGAAFNTAAFSIVNLVNGASSSNVFWQVVGATGIGANSSMSGTILTDAAITVGAGATLTGRALSSAVITLASNTITTADPSPGTLRITTAAATNLGTFTIPIGGRTISGPLGSVYIDDTRGGSSNAGWVVSVSATAFAPPSGPPIPATSIRYSPGPIVQIAGTVTYTVAAPNDLTVRTATVTATGASGTNAATTAWNPTLTVDIPGDAVAGIYGAVLTYTVV